jgi:hypothetical protein
MTSVVPIRALARCAAALLALAAAPAAAQQVQVMVAVSDSATGAPVAGARVTLDGRAVTADAGGMARFSAPAGSRELVVTRLGYGEWRRDVTVGPAATGVPVRLVPAALAVQGVEGRVETAPRARSPRIQEFYRRKEGFGTGHFITRDWIERRKIRRGSDLFRGVPNLQVAQLSGRQVLRVGRARSIHRSGDGREAALTSNPLEQNAPQSAGDCDPLVYVDGISTIIEHLDVEIDPNQVEGVEVYTGTRVPPQFGGSRAACGVIAIWTRESAGLGPAPRPARAPAADSTAAAPVAARNP